MPKKDSFEKSLEELKKMADKIKSEDTGLEEAIGCFEKGMEHYEICYRILSDARQKIETFEQERSDDRRL